MVPMTTGPVCIPIRRRNSIPASGFLTDLCQTSLDRQRREQGVAGMGVSGNRASALEEGHHAVTQELVDPAMVTVDRIEDDAEGLVHQSADVFRIEALRHGGESGDVSHKDGHLLAGDQRAEGLTALAAEAAGGGGFVLTPPAPPGPSLSQPDRHGVRIGQRGCQAVTYWKHREFARRARVFSPIHGPASGMAPGREGRQARSP
jgi:hypothetical protein